MKAFRIFALCVFGLLPLAAYGQISPSTSGSLQHFTLTGSAAGFLGSATGSQPTSIVGASFSLTKAVSLGYEQITVPSTASYDFGIAEFTKPLSSIVGKSLTSKFTFDATKVEVTFLGGAGKLLQSSQGISELAETAGAYLSYPVTANMSVQVIGAQWLHSTTQGNGFIVSPSTAAISTGLSINF